MPLDIITAPNINTSHGFIARSGGFSQKPHHSLNLGLNTKDNLRDVEQNQDLVLKYFNSDRQHACMLKQIHSDDVLEAKPSWFEQTGDAMVSNAPQLLLIIKIADCLPILFHDPSKKVIAAIHCGWRSTVKGIVNKTIQKMCSLYSSKPADITVAMGMCIRKDKYQVGDEVISSFLAAGFPKNVYTQIKDNYYLDLALANRTALLEAGITENHIWDSGLCTFNNQQRFFSHRRDKGQTGRHWAVIGQLLR